jgi:hypothetical protein
MRRYLPALGFFSAAIACHALGSGIGGNAFLLLGAAFEVVAWRKALHPKK